MRKLWKGIIILIILSPLGIILPYFFNAGAAWGEWSSEELKEFIGYVPQELAKLENLGKPLFPDYNLKIWEKGGLLEQSMGYIITGFVGVGIVVLIMYLLGKLAAKGRENE
ncbi:MAG: cobalamin biosynthesis protein [Dictyoglomaceae bacterium]|nr:cobalamin biosynthesis protein [Dictyoglomaceae bacterium]